MVEKAAKEICRSDFPEDWERYWEGDEEMRHRYTLGAEAALRSIGLVAEVRAEYTAPDSLSHRWVTKWAPGSPRYFGWSTPNHNQVIKIEDVRGTGEAAASADPQERRCNKTEDLVGDGSQPAREVPS